jgi:Domain of unknown function (DUF4873)
VSEHEDEDRGYDGPVRVHLGESVVEVRGQLHGFFQPIDGSYHWYGRLAPDDRLSAQVAERGRTAIEIAVGAGARVPARLGERNPWGGHRITGTGAPPFA